MIPFAISTRVPGGVCATRLADLQLDAMLAYVVLRTQLGEDFWAPNEPLIEAELPLARREYGGDWYWCCSAAQGQIETRDIHYWHRRFNEDEAHRIDFAGRRGKIITEGGPMRDHRGARSVLYPGSLTWYLLGNPEAVWELVQDLPFIGKGHSQGEGRAWWSKPVLLDEDRSVWDGNRLVRPIPAGEALEAGRAFDFEYRTLRPPYWDVRTKQLCAVNGYAG